jgi:hypothetical protein
MVVREYEITTCTRLRLRVKVKVKGQWRAYVNIVRDFRKARNL